MNGSEFIAPLMFGTVLLFIFSGYPVAFSLGGVSLIFACIGVQMGYFDWAFLYSMPERVFGIMSNYVLLAVPFFIFMGTMLEKSRLAEDLLKTIGILFGPARGGLALSVVFVGALLAAATGVIGASVVAMGLISLPVMMQFGYSKTLSTGVIAASGTLGQIIPPSVVLVVLADQLGVSVGDLFVGSLTPGIILAAMYAIYVAGVAWLRPAAAAAPHPGRARQYFCRDCHTDRGGSPRSAGFDPDCRVLQTSHPARPARNHGEHRAADHDGGLPPHRLYRICPRIPGALRRHLDREPNDEPPRRQARSPRRGEPADFCAGVLHRFFRNRFHRHPPAGTGIG
jgi:hypothetical protein